MLQVLDTIRLFVGQCTAVTFGQANVSQAPGYHNYWMIVDEAVTLDPGTNGNRGGAACMRSLRCCFATDAQTGKMEPQMNACGRIN
jgi:hypothetical protein